MQLINYINKSNSFNLILGLKYTLYNMRERRRATLNY